MITVVDALNPAIQRGEPHSTSRLPHFDNLRDVIAEYGIVAGPVSPSTGPLAIGQPLARYSL